MWWIFVLADAIPVALLGILVEVMYIRLSRRADIYEAATTMRLDLLIKARQEQLEALEAQAMQHAYGVPARNSRPFVPSRPLGGVPSAPRRATLPPNLPPLDEWEGWASRQNGQIHAAEWPS